MTKIKSLNNFPLFILFLTWCGLFIGRKTFSYISISGIYIIEFTLLVSIILLIIRMFRSPINNLARLSIYSKLILISSLLFIIYNILRALFSDDINFKGLIPGIYPVIFLITFFIAINSNYNNLIKINRIILLFYLNGWLISLFVSNVLQNIFGAIEAPGWTYVYGVSLTSSLLIPNNKIKSIFIFILNFLFAILLFERASFFNFILSFLFTLFIFKNSIPRNIIFNSFSKIFIAIFIGLLLAPLALNFLFDASNFRFDLDTKNILNFFYSIVNSNADIGAGLSGTRDHRIDMWKELFEYVSSNISTIIFGIGYKGEVLDILGVDFRAPHNGFVTIFVRGGLAGLFFYTFFLITIFYKIKEKGIETNATFQSKLIAMIVFLSFIGDALTGTIIDSPFTSFIVYFNLAVIFAQLELSKRNNQTNL